MIDPVFLSHCRQAVADMRRHGMNEMLIACVLTDIRAAGVLEERRRLDRILSANPPEFEPSGVMRDALAPDKD